MANKKGNTYIIDEENSFEIGILKQKGVVTMKVLNNPPRKTTCRCGAELEYNNDDIKHGDDTFRHEYEDYIICPNCNRKIVLNSGSHCSRPYD